MTVFLSYWCFVILDVYKSVTRRNVADSSQMSDVKVEKANDLVKKEMKYEVNTSPDRTSIKKEHSISSQLPKTEHNTATIKTCSANLEKKTGSTSAGK